MKISTLMKSGLAAIVLASSFAMPAAAHGPIRYQEIYLDGPGGNPVGYLYRYCDRHLEVGGEITIWADVSFFECP